jgi:hypothetical protein
MRKLLDHKAFSIGRDAYQWRDVILAAMGSGEWRVLELMTRRGLVAARHASAAGLTLPDAALDDAARKFRYERNLASGRDAEVWLARWELDVTAWKESLRRALLLERFGDVLRGLTLVPDSFDRETVLIAMHADAVCTSLYDRFARTLSARVAAHERVGAGAAEPDGDLEKAMARVDPVLLGMTAEEARRRLAWFRSLQGSVDRFHRVLVSDDRVREWIDARKLDWTRFTCRLGVFPDRDAASEALFCVRDDGRDLAEVAVAAGATLADRRFFLDEAEPAARSALRGARAGDVVGPIQIGDDWVIFDVREKRLPIDADPAVRRRAETELLADGVEREIERSVRWSIA